MTGVQTCALPILGKKVAKAFEEKYGIKVNATKMKDSEMTRSEERRVGKECRYRRWRDKGKKKGGKHCRKTDIECRNKCDIKKRVRGRQRREG